MECQNPMCRYGKDDNCMNPKHKDDNCMNPKDYIKRATKKPLPIEFVEWTGENLKEVIAFTGRHKSSLDWSWPQFKEVVAKAGLKIFTRKGALIASVGDVIIKEVDGGVHPCKPGIFAKTYDVIE